MEQYAVEGGNDYAVIYAKHLAVFTTILLVHNGICFAKNGNGEALAAIGGLPNAEFLSAHDVYTKKRQTLSCLYSSWV